MQTEWYRCTVCHALDRTVNWSDTSEREATYGLNNAPDDEPQHELVDYSGPRRMIPLCIHCHERATLVHPHTAMMLDMVKPVGRLLSDEACICSETRRSIAYLGHHIDCPQYSEDA